MTATVLTEAIGRLSTIDQVLRLIAATEDPLKPDPATRALKGLVFVQLYAVYEYVIVDGLRAVLREFNLRPIPLCDIRRPLLALALDAEFASIRTAAIERTWEVRGNLIARLTAPETAAIQESLFPKDGSFFRVSQLNLLWRLLDAPTPVLPDRRLQGRVEELIDNRNHIAHGNAAPENIGGRYTVQDLKDRVVDTRELCSHILQAFAALVSGQESFR